MFFVVAMFFVTQGVLLGEKRNDAKSGADIVVVLGSAYISPGMKKSESKERIDAATEYGRANPGGILILSGGKNEGPVADALVFKEYMESKGTIPYDRVLLEDQATNTYENIKFTKELLEREQIQKVEIVYVTHAYHGARARILATKLGLPGTFHTVPGGWTLFKWLKETIGILYAILFQW